MLSWTVEELHWIALSAGEEGQTVIEQGYSWRQSSNQALASGLLVASLGLIVTAVLAVLQDETNAPVVAVVTLIIVGMFGSLAAGYMFLRLRQLHVEYAATLLWYSIVRAML